MKPAARRDQRSAPTRTACTCLSPEVVARLDLVADVLSTPGVPATRSDAMRACVAVGLPIFEQDRARHRPTTSSPAESRS